MELKKNGKCGLSITKKEGERNTKPLDLWHQRQNESAVSCVR